MTEYGNVSEIATAIATVTLTVATAALVWVAQRQLSGSRTEQQKWATLEACNRYDYDRTIDTAKRAVHIWTKQHRDVGDGVDMCYHVNNLLNYFDALCIGIDQGLYLKEIVRDHMGNVIKHKMARFREIAETDKAVKELLATLTIDFQFISKHLQYLTAQEATTSYQD